MVIMNDLKWPILSYYVIYYEKLRKVMQRTEKETKWISNILADSLYSRCEVGYFSWVYTVGVKLAILVDSLPSRCEVGYFSWVYTVGVKLAILVEFT